MTKTTVKRRRFLVVLGTVGTVTLAGCNSGDGGGSPPTESPIPSPTSSPTPTSTTPNEQAVEHYERAIEELARNKEQHDEWVANEFEGAVAGNFSLLRDRLESARAALDEAEAAASSSDFIARINQARLVADIQELRVAYNEGALTVVQLIDDGKVLYYEQEEHELSADKFAEAKTLIGELGPVLDDFKQLLDTYDNDVLNEPELEYSREHLDYFILDDRRRLDAVERYADAYERINLTWVQFYTGTTHWENEAWTGAREAWETARTHAQDALSSAQAVIDNDYSPDAYHNDVSEQIDGIATFIEALDKFVEGGKEAEDGNVERGKSLVSEGFDIMEGG